MNGCSMIIVHHGIKGMHWGIRRFQNRDGTLTKAGKLHEKKRTDEEEIDRRAEQILYRIGRFEKERELQRLTKESLDERSDARKALDEALLDAGKTVVSTMLTGGKNYYTVYTEAGAFNLDDLAKQVFANPYKKK